MGGLLLLVPASHINRVLVLVGLLLTITCPPIAANPVVVGGEDGYEPYETLNENAEPVGFNIDLMRAVGEATGRDVRFRLGEWDEMRRALQAGEIDVLGMFVSERRAETVDFAKPHIIVHHRIFLPTAAEPIERIQDLADRKVIVQDMAWSHEYLLQSGLDVDLTLVEDDRAGLKLLARGRHDAALLTEHRGRHAMRLERLDNLTVSGPPVLPVEYAFAVRKGDSQLLDTLNAGLGQVMASGKFDRIYDRWLRPEGQDEGIDLPGPVPVALAALALIGLFGWLLRRLLSYRRKVSQAHDELAYLREHDGLTGLLSRHALERRIETLTQSVDRQAHSLLQINVDQFRVINDTLGHAQADRVLCRLGSWLRERTPAGAAIARLGADEFAVVLERTGRDEARALGKRLLAGLEHGLPDRARMSQPLTLSIGLVTFAAGEDEVATVLRQADSACLAAKEEGGGQVHAWQPDDQMLAEKYGELRWVARIQAALTEDRMVAFWQPIVDSRGPPWRAVSVEILVRMRHEDPNREPIAAGQFMPAAERYFVSPQIDRKIIGKMLEWMEANPGAVRGLERINLNISGRSLGDRRFLEFLGRRMGKHAHLLPRLCLEVTETALIGNIDQARQTLERLHRGGCRIALDDFGVGASSMNYLRQLPVDYLKIDGSFVRNIDSDREAFDFIREINRLGHAMNKITVAECVETESVAACLRDIGVDRMQGYLFGHPAPIDELSGYLEGLESAQV